MPSVRYMAWNIQVFGPSKCTEANGYTELIQLIGQVMLHYDVTALAICEVRGDWGADIGERLKTYLCTTQSVAAGTWDSEPSIKFINGFHEQYLFVWDTRRLGLYNDSFLWDFHTAAAPTKVIGFPRKKTRNRSPFLAYFCSIDAPVVNLPCAMFHAPKPEDFDDIRDAFKKMATADELLSPATDCCVVMGDTNVPAVANSLVDGSNGKLVFGPMLNVDFTQLIPGVPAVDVRTSLKAAASAPAIHNADDAYSEPYDTMLFRAPAAPLGPPPPPGDPPPPAVTPVTPSNARRCDLITDCTGANYLGAYLRALHTKRDPSTVPATATYTTFAAAFTPFRQFVSDHVPVITQLDW